MRTSFLVLLGVLFMQSAFAKLDSLDFPRDWQGKWLGELKIYSATGLQQNVAMELQILPLENEGEFTWTIIYGEDKEAGKRGYLLKTIDASKGEYLIDEQNSILLESYVLGEKFFNRYDVMGNMILITLEQQGKHLVFEVLSGKMDPVSITGDTIFNEEEIPAVKTFPLRVYQKAVLGKVE